MNTPFSPSTDIKSRDLLSVSMQLVRENSPLFLKKAFLYLFSISLFLMVSETIYETVITQGIFKSMYMLFEGDAEIMANPLFDIDILVSLSLIKNLGFGIFYGLSAVLLSQHLIRPTRLREQHRESEIKSNNYENSGRKDWIIKTVVLAFVGYIPMALIEFFSELYIISELIDLKDSGFSFILGVVNILLYIAYIPLLVLALPFLTEEKNTIRVAIKKAWIHYTSNFWHIMLSVMGGYIIIIAMQQGISLVYELFYAMSNELFGFSSGSEEATTYVFYASVFKVIFSSILFICALFVPLMGFSFYYLINKYGKKLDLETAYTDMLSRLESKGKIA